MNIEVCDYCKLVDGVLVVASDIVPAFTMIKSRRKVDPLGLCEKHEALLFPDELSLGKGNGNVRRQYKKQTVADRDETDKPKKLGANGHSRKLKEVEADGVNLLNTRQIAELINRPMKSMGYVLRNSKPVGKGRVDGFPIFVYRRDRLVRDGILEA